jgi:SOS response regulatory protein OraA/RecX
MYSRYYRFLVLPKQKHAAKAKIAEAMVQDGYSVDQIKNIWAWLSLLRNQYDKNLSITVGFIYGEV